MLFALVAASLWATPSQAAQKCEEVVSQRFCSDNATKSVEYAPGAFSTVTPPVIDGFATACWSWTRQFQCVETDPIYSCASGTPFNTVKSDCSLTAAAVNDSVQINGVYYITSATYDYKCKWGEWIETDVKLPAGLDCAPLSKEVITDLESAPVAPSNSDPATASLTDSMVVKQQKDNDYVCYKPPVTECVDTCYERVVDKESGTISKKEVPCQGAVSNCTPTRQQCEGDGWYDGEKENYDATQTLGPDGRCIKTFTDSICQSGPIPRCLTKENCELSKTTPTGILDNGVATTQEQTYICSNTTESCTQYANVSNCVHATAWGWDDMGLIGQVGQGLGEVNQALAKLEGIEKGQKPDDPYIFSGMDLRCHFAVGNFLNTFIAVVAVAAIAVATGGAGLVGLQGALGITAQQAAAVTIGAAFVDDAPDSKTFGAECCKDYVIEGSDAWYKLGACTADEVKLSVARMKDLDVYLGEYCSKKSGFPIKQCVQRTKTYCVFDDMLALTVNEQGRQQLDQLAMADTVHTVSSPELRYPLFSPHVTSGRYSDGMNNGKWVKRTNVAGRDIWTWQYPGYCVSQEAQKAGYQAYLAELNALASTKGIEPGKMTEAEAAAVLKAMLGAPPYQECSDMPGLMYVMTCEGGTCDETKMPKGPGIVESDFSGNLVEIDPNWRINQSRTYYLPGDYGVVATMPSDSSFAAVTASLTTAITGTGSCHSNGDCLYQFAVTPLSAGAGVRKKVTETIRFPLYTMQHTATLPAVDYVAKDGTLDMNAWKADPNRGLGNPVSVSTQRFIFRPNYLTKTLDGNLHTKVLLEYANKATVRGEGERDFIPLMVPTNLPATTTGWYPYGSGAGTSFYISGGCDKNSLWCEYKIEVDLSVERHPWGTEREPRCWGFSLDQLAALDFNKMDLSKWINSLDFGTDINGMSTQAANAMTSQVTNSAQAFYGAMKDGNAVTKPSNSTQALVVNADTLPNLSGESFQAYTLQAAIPSNWPSYYDDAPNNNPVSSPMIDWGDGTPMQAMPKHPGGRGYVHSHDYGDKPVGNYTIRVTLNTAANGPQVLTKSISITPNGGALPAGKKDMVFNNPGSNAAALGNYSPSTTTNGTSQAPGNLQTTAPGMVDQFCRQGNTVGTSTPGSTLPECKP